MTQTDLFGNPVDLQAMMDAPLTAPTRKKRKPTVANGYATTPGTGPAGETCKTCKNIVRRHSESGKSFLKCALRNWTNGTGTDIRASSPACSGWEAKKPEAAE